MAGCKICGTKFFTDPRFTSDALKAEQYLFNKFLSHKCKSGDWEQSVPVSRKDEKAF